MTDWDDAEKRVEKAHELYERGRWEEALSELKAAISINPYNGSWHFNLGLTYDAMDRFDEAIVAYRRALEIDPDDVEVLTAIGHDCNRTGHFEESLKFFEHVESIDASHEPCYCNRIYAYAEKGDHEKAEEMFFLARQYKDRCCVCYYNMAHSLFMRGSYDRVLWCLRQVIEIDPEHPQVHARMAEACWAKGQFGEARTHFIEELRSDPGDIDIMLDLGELLVEMNELTAAGEKFRQVLELAPEECTALFHLGQLAMHDGDLVAAVEAFRQCLRIDRAYPGAHLSIAQILYRQKNLTEALFHANCELTQQTAEEVHLLDVGNLFMDMHELQSAEASFRRILSMHSESAAARHNLAVTLLLGGRTDEGIEEAKQALRIQPKYMLAMHNLALAYLTKRDLPRARAWLREALDITPDDPQLRSLQHRLRIATALHSLKRLPRKLIGR